MQAVASSSSWTLIGAHGGAGTTTVVELLNYRRSVAIAAEFDGTWPQGRRLAVVARSTAAGAAHAAETLASWPTQLDQPVLLVVADAPFPPAALARHRIRAISRGVPVVFVPYLWALRNLDTPAALRMPQASRTARRLQRRLLLSERQTVDH
ncbi:UNVERIFIED_ORG: hypothetical protein FHR35_009150 [Microbispora rosea subsp. rosea]